ncbi:MAG: hypothetical protein WAS54_08450 [Scrofimicrobium sp.]
MPDRFRAELLMPTRQHPDQNTVRRTSGANQSRVASFGPVTLGSFEVRRDELAKPLDFLLIKAILGDGDIGFARLCSRKWRECQAYFQRFGSFKNDLCGGLTMSCIVQLVLDSFEEGNRFFCFGVVTNAGCVEVEVVEGHFT